MQLTQDYASTPVPAKPCSSIQECRGSGAWNPAFIVHMPAAVGAVVIGAAVLSMRKGTKAHRRMGRAWTVAMVTTCVSSFGVRERTGRFSWIHSLSVFTLSTLGAGIYHIRRKNVAKHKAFMGAACISGVVAGVFAVLGASRGRSQDLISKSS